MLRGLTTVSFFADDVPAARDWYAALLGLEPYFARPVAGPPAYVEFRIGEHQHELGILDRRFAPRPATAQAGGGALRWQLPGRQFYLSRSGSRVLVLHAPDPVTLDALIARF